MKLGISESAQLDHMATRLVYIDVRDQKDVPDRFHYIGQSWLYMYRPEIYSEDEYINHLGRHPDHNLLMTNNGVVQVSITEPGRHLGCIKNENRASYKRNAGEKRQQSERAKARNEATRKAEQAPAYGQTPAKKGAVSSAARTSERAALKSHPSVLVLKLVNGTDGTESGTKRSSDTDVSSGKRARQLLRTAPNRF